MIEAVIERCAGIDVGQKFLVVCVMSGSLEAEPKTEIQRSGPSRRRTPSIASATGTHQEGCKHAVKMEETLVRIGSRY